MIKDQCAHCKSKEVCLLEKVYDSHSCDQYVKGIDLEKQSIDLDKKDSTSMDSHQETILTSESPIENKPIITQEYLQQNTKIRDGYRFSYLQWPQVDYLAQSILLQPLINLHTETT